MRIFNEHFGNFTPRICASNNVYIADLVRLGIQGNNAGFSLCLPRLHTEGMEIHLHSFLTLALDEGDWLAGRSCCFFSEENPCKPLNSWVVGPQNQFGQTGKEKKIMLLRRYEPRIRPSIVVTGEQV
jgi:hypothetical protein